MSFINFGFGGGNWGVTFWAGTQLNSESNNKDKLISGQANIRGQVSRTITGQALIKQFIVKDIIGTASVKKDYIKDIYGESLIIRLTPNDLVGIAYIYNDLIGSGLYKPAFNNTGTLQAITLEDAGLYKPVGIEKGKY